MKKPYLIPLPQKPGRSPPQALSREHPQAKVADGVLSMSILSEIGGLGGFAYEDFEAALDSAEGQDYDTIRIDVNSPGGDVWHGVALYNRLVGMDQRVEVTAPGLIASAATLVAMAADEFLIGEAARMMVHSSWTVALGDSEEMEKTAEMLREIDRDIAAIYSKKTGIGMARIESMMQEETWMNGKSAVRQNFADGLMPEAKTKAKAKSNLNAWLQKHRIK